MKSTWLQRNIVGLDETINVETVWSTLWCCHWRELLGQKHRKPPRRKSNFFGEHTQSLNWLTEENFCDNLQCKKTHVLKSCKVYSYCTVVQGSVCFVWEWCFYLPSAFKGVMILARTPVKPLMFLSQRSNSKKVTETQCPDFCLCMCLSFTLSHTITVWQRVIDRGYCLFMPDKCGQYLAATSFAKT